MRYATTALMLIGLSGCATSIPATSDFCSIYEPVTVVRQPKEAQVPIDPFNMFDTKITVGQVEVNNGAYECVCNKDCPKGN